MIIGACGFGSTGSSVVTDYLNEFDGVSVKDDLEFTWVSRVDGLIDLERAVMNPHSRMDDSLAAMRRFEEMTLSRARVYERHGFPKAEFVAMIKEFMDAITTVTWEWYDNKVKPSRTPKYAVYYVMKRKIIPRMELKAGKHVKVWPLKTVRASVHPENFYVEAKKVVNRLLQAVGLDTNGIIALDQPFAGNNPQACFPFYDDPYAVVVDRDPRDNYVFARTRMLGKFHYMPINTVEDFIAYYRALRKDQPYLQDDPRILRIRFEDMVYEYESTAEKLRDFLKLPENPRPRSVFDPELSIANTQVFERYPQFAEDIKVIERELPEYLFDYSKYPKPDASKKMFYGKSPKHKNFKQSYSE